MMNPNLLSLLQRPQAPSFQANFVLPRNISDPFLIKYRKNPTKLNTRIAELAELVAPYKQLDFVDPKQYFKAMRALNVLYQVQSMLARESSVLQTLGSYKEESAVFSADKYVWFTYNSKRGQKIIQRNGKNEIILREGDKFGVRTATSSKTAWRLITLEKGVTIVYSFEEKAINLLTAKSRKCSVPRSLLSSDKPPKAPAELHGKKITAAQLEKMLETLPKDPKDGTYDFKWLSRCTKTNMNKLVKKLKSVTPKFNFYTEKGRTQGSVTYTMTNGLLKLELIGMENATLIMQVRVNNKEIPIFEHGGTKRGVPLSLLSGEVNLMPTEARAYMNGWIKLHDMVSKGMSEFLKPSVKKVMELSAMDKRVPGAESLASEIAADIIREAEFNPSDTNLGSRLGNLEFAKAFLSELSLRKIKAAPIMTVAGENSYLFDKAIVQVGNSYFDITGKIEEPKEISKKAFEYALYDMRSEHPELAPFGELVSYKLALPVVS